MPSEWLVVSASRPGKFDGIGDYSARLTQALSATTSASLIGCAPEDLPAELDGVTAVCLQYYPHAFAGAHGRQMRRWLRTLRAGNVTVITTMHEMWPPADGSIRRTVSRALMRRRARSFVDLSSRIVCTQERSTRELAEAGLVDAERVSLIPVGSNIERIDVTPMAPRSAQTLTLFGQPAAMHGPTLALLAEWLAQQQGSVTLRWLNRSEEEARATWSGALGLSDAHVEFFGGLDARDASAVLASADVAIAPYVDGVSTRRTTLVAQLEHALPVVGTDGESTGALLRHHAALVLSPVGAADDFVRNVERVLANVETRTAMATAAGEMFETEFSWSRIATAYRSLVS